MADSSLPSPTFYPVRCPDNEPLVAHFLAERQALGERGGLTENLDLTLAKAHRNIASCKTPITTLKELSQIKNVGKWILRMMKGFFPEDADGAQNGKKRKSSRRYLPQKNSAAYALLITLYREVKNGKDFMLKQELVDAAEASGLSRTLIAREKGIGKPGQMGNSQRDWYTGWCCMKGLITKGLVARNFCPAKYMLTEEGKEAAQECLMRSGVVDSDDIMDMTNEPVGSSQNVPENIVVQKTNIQVDHVDISDSDSVDDSDSAELPRKSSTVGPSTGNVSCWLNAESIPRPPSCSSFDPQMFVPVSKANEIEDGSDCGAMPPGGIGEKFEDTYDVILILDDREIFGSRSRKVHDILNSQFKVQVEKRRLPVGDAVWIARNKLTKYEYVLDFIVERKRVDDLLQSINDNRYKDQKLRLLRCGLLNVIYLVEGDPNKIEVPDSVKTACFTTEIMEGFDVQRTTCLTETLQKYGHLTQAISHFYRKQFSNGMNHNCRVCPSYEAFVEECKNIGRMTITKIFALQLMQIPQVTEEIALAVIDMYPTLISLAEAYALLEGNARVQEQMLKNQNNLIGAGASRNIYKLVWGS